MTVPQLEPDAGEATPEKVAAALHAARRYYVEGLTMERIAREMRTSRSSVSRLISFARDAGLVEIRLAAPGRASEALETRLHARTGVAVHVVPVPAQDDDNLLALRHVAEAAGRLLGSLVDSDCVLGVAWGTTTSAIARALTPKHTTNARVVQLNGAGNMRSTGLAYASDIMGRFGAAYAARVQEFPVPAFFDYPETKAALWRERSIRRILDLQRRMDLAVFSIGALDGPVPSHVYTAGYLEAADFAALRRDGVVGDVATVFFRSDGGSQGISLNERASGPDLHMLTQVPRRVCVISGEAKVQGLLGVLAGGIATDVVLDESAARRLDLELERAA